MRGALEWSQMAADKYATGNCAKNSWQLRMQIAGKHGCETIARLMRICGCYRRPQPAAELIAAGCPGADPVLASRQRVQALVSPSMMTMITAQAA